MQLDLFDSVDTGAIFSPCGKYRYRLWRKWKEGKTLLALMLNPSTADQSSNDPTVERMERRARRMSGYGQLVVANIFAFRATEPEDMKAEPEPVGPENNLAIIQAATEADMIIAGWGNHGDHLNRSSEIRKLLQDCGAADKTFALRFTGKGEPGHPLYVKYEVKPVPLFKKGE